MDALQPFEPTLPVAAGGLFTATIAPPAGITDPLVARVEVPVSGAIESTTEVATISPDVAAVVLQAPVTPGLYQVHWLTNGPVDQIQAILGQPITQPLIVGVGGAVLQPWPVVDVEAVTPDVSEVSDLEHRRIVAQGGGTEGIFDENTEPTEAEVRRIADQATAKTLADLPTDFPTDVYDSVRHAAALYAAILIEMSWFGEQAGEGSVAGYQALYSATVRSITSTIESELREQFMTEMATTGVAGVLS